MSEVASYNTLRKNAFLPVDRVDRVENLCLAGMADCSVTAGGVDAWIEIKTPTREPARDRTPLLGSNHRLSQEQANWFLMLRKAGGRGFIYIDAPSRRYLLDCKHADRVNEMTTAQLMMAAIWTTAKPTPAERWADFREKVRAG